MKRKDVLSIETGSYQEKLGEFRKELIKLNAQSAAGTAMKNPGLLKQTKKNIARMLTLINSKKSTEMKVTKNK
ncbi:MAG TPA: 50S ribosomal protein L29 [Candidatus Nanoarchaeia archaeon]|nr:50S ribosomal protein L29 [Candidatus Nanoarchaeia archaeon]